MLTSSRGGAAPSGEPTSSSRTARGRTPLWQLATAMIVAGCSTTSGGGDAPVVPAPSSTTITVAPDEFPPGIKLSFIQQRIDEGTGRAQVRVVNGTEHGIRVRAVGVDWAGFPGEVQPIRYRISGQTILDLRYHLPRADCSARAGAAPMYGVAVTAARTIRRPMLPDGRRFLSRIWRSECDARRIARTVGVTYDFSGSPAGSEEGAGLNDVRHARLVLTRIDGTGPDDADDVTVSQVQGSVLFELALPGGRRLDAGARRALVPLDVTPGRCDEHGRSQSTQSFAWHMFLRLGDGDPLPLIVEPTPAQQAVLLGYLDRACGDITAH